MLARPVTERLHRAFDQAVPQRGQPVLDPGRRLREGATVHQAVGAQPAQRFGEDLVAHAADRGPQLAAPPGARAQRHQDDGIPGVGEQVGRRPQAAVRDQLHAGVIALAHPRHRRRFLTHRSVRKQISTVGSAAVGGTREGPCGSGFWAPEPWPRHWARVGPGPGTNWWSAAGRGRRRRHSPAVWAPARGRPTRERWSPGGTQCCSRCCGAASRTCCATWTPPPAPWPAPP